MPGNCRLTKILSDEERAELESAIRSALAAERPKMVEEVKQAVSDDLDVRFELMGLSGETPDAREEIRKDFEFMRGLRKAYRAAGTRIGAAILTLVLTAAAALAGYGAWLKGWIISR